MADPTPPVAPLDTETDQATSVTPFPAHARASEEVARPSDEPARLLALHGCGILDTPPEPAFDDLTRLASEICGTSGAVISLVDETRHWFKSRLGVAATESPRKVSFCAHAILDPARVMIVPDATRDARFASNELVTGEMGVRFYAGAPLVLESGHAIGTLCVFDRQPRELSAAQCEALAALARQVVSQIQLRSQNAALLRARTEQEALTAAQKAMTDTLQRRTNELRLLFDYLPALIVFKDTKNGLLRVNQRLADSVGMPVAEIEGKSTEDIYPNDAAKYYADDLEVIRSGVPKLGIVETFRDAEGRDVWIQTDKVPVRAPEGEITGVVAMAQEITERMHANEQIRASEALIRQFVQHAPAAIAMFDTEMRYVQVSDRWVKDFHLEGRELIGRSHYEIFPDLPERWKAVHRRCLAGAVERSDEDPLQWPDGRVDWFQWELRPWSKPGGKIGGVILFTLFITERKLTQARLLESESRFRKAIEYSALGVGLVALDGRILRVNRAFCAMVGRTEEEMLATTIFEITHPDDRALSRAVNQAFLASDEDHFQYEKRYLHKDGSTVWVTIAVTSVRDAAGRRIEMLGQIEDITTRYEAAARLKASLAEKEILLQEVHHRVKNNLQVVASLLSLQSGSIQDPELRTQFQECQGRVRTMALIHEKLYQSENLARVNLQDYLGSLARMVFGTYRTSASVKLELALDSVSTDIDTAVPLGLLVNELLTNALKHAFPSGRAGHMRLALAPAEMGGFTLEVEDDGIGFTGEGEGQPKLGIRLVAMFVQQLRAEMTTQSQPGQTRFFLRCPDASVTGEVSPTGAN